MSDFKLYAVVGQFDPNSQKSFFKVDTLLLIDFESNELNPIYFKTISDNGLILNISPSEFGKQVFLNLQDALDTCAKRNSELTQIEYAMSHGAYNYARNDSKTINEVVCGVDLVRASAYWMTVTEYAKRHDAIPSGIGAGNVYCSNCEKMNDKKTEYCPNCGRVMTNA